VRSGQLLLHPLTGGFGTLCQKSRFESRSAFGQLRKWIKVFGAPVEDADAKAIREYLAKNY